MSKFVCGFAIILATLCLLNNGVTADPVTCSAAVPTITVNASELAGVWYEVARSPSNSMNCVAVNIGVDNDTLTLSTTYASSPDALYQNSTATATVSLADAATNNGAINVTYNSNDLQPAMLKLLDTDYTSFAIVCGYTNASDDSTSFGVILSRTRMPTNATIMEWEQNAAVNYTNFNTNMTLLEQSEMCTQNGASSLAVMSSMIALLYAFLKFVN